MKSLGNGWYATTITWPGGDMHWQFRAASAKEARMRVREQKQMLESRRSGKGNAHLRRYQVTPE